MSDINYFHIFNTRISEGETVVTQESDKDKILRTSKKVSAALAKLLSTQSDLNDHALQELQTLITDIRVIAYKPSTFRIIVANDNFFDLIYDPAPMQVQNPDDYQAIDSFTARVSGKKYKIGVNSEFQQCISAINKIMRENPVGIPEPGADEEIPPTDDTTAPDDTTPPEEDKNATDKKEPTK